MTHPWASLALQLPPPSHEACPGGSELSEVSAEQIPGRQKGRFIWLPSSLPHQSNKWHRLTWMEWGATAEKGQRCYSNKHPVWGVGFHFILPSYGLSTSLGSTFKTGSSGCVTTPSVRLISVRALPNSWSHLPDQLLLLWPSSLDHG